MRQAQITLSEPQAAFFADAVILLSALLKKDAKLVDDALRMVTQSLRGNMYSPTDVNAVLMAVHTLADAWEHVPDVVITPPPGGMVS